MKPETEEELMELGWVTMKGGLHDSFQWTKSETALYRHFFKMGWEARKSFERCFKESRRGDK